MGTYHAISSSSKVSFVRASFHVMSSHAASTLYITMVDPSPLHAIVNPIGNVHDNPLKSQPQNLNQVCIEKRIGKGHVIDYIVDVQSQLMRN